MMISSSLFDRIYGFVTGALLLGSAMAVVGSPAMAQSAEGDPGVTVDMTNTLEFVPDTVRVEPGATIRWVNGSMIVHTVTADPDQATKDESAQLPEGASAFDSGDLDPDASFDHTFTVPGTYRYFCIPHEGTKMYGTVIVEPGDG